MGIPHPRIHLKVFIFSVAFTLLTIGIVRFSKDPKNASRWRNEKIFPNGTHNVTISRIPSKDELRRIWIQKKIERLSSKFAEGAGKTNSSFEKPKYKPMKEANSRAHIFYYAWYRNVELDQVSRHWNDDDPGMQKDAFGLYKTDSLSGIRLSFYPKEGFYSSRNETVVAKHMGQLKKAGIGVIVVYWKPPGFEDSPEEVLEMLLSAALENGIKVALHVSPYYNWTLEHLLEQLKIFLKKYGSHKGIYRLRRRNRDLPVFYVYDPFDLGSSAWASVLSPTGSSSIRNTELDGVFIGLLADQAHRMEIKKSQFDVLFQHFKSHCRAFLISEAQNCITTNGSEQTYVRDD
ncbi:unnamed protein product [Nesidiocoris tenuis]|uniref:Uncharacterized protein n=1 Tax=Nesidiocoris tenuis TaxID=355587 RepID=A0A6H5G2M8_9HEMI|nr:unnamed protein product [Nesidiocoris tenuis]